LRRGEALLVLVAEDGSDAQTQKILPLAEAREVPVEVLGSRNELGGAVGSGPLTAMAVTQSSFAEQVRVRLGRE
jgi:ribosomal protein L7Ae-like RNA K-turn-binding protein